MMLCGEGRYNGCIAPDQRVFLQCVDCTAQPAVADRPRYARLLNGTPLCFMPGRLLVRRGKNHDMRGKLIKTCLRPRLDLSKPSTGFSAISYRHRERGTRRPTGMRAEETRSLVGVYGSEPTIQKSLWFTIIGQCARKKTSLYTNSGIPRFGRPKGTVPLYVRIRGGLDS